MTNSGRKLSDLASHLIIPDGIVKTRFPRIAKLAKIAGITYDPWQQGLLTLMYGLRRDGKYACGAGGLAASLPRQVGKTFTFGTAAFLDCLLTPGLKVPWTAHRSRTSDETFASMQTLAHDAKLARYVATIRRANGQQEIGFHNGSRILFGAREQGFGRGFDGIDQIVFDEAQILTERALDDMVPATNTAANPLIVMIGTPPKPGDPAEIFRDKRRTALAGADKDLLYVEFSAPRGSDLDDREAWTAANPSYPQRTSETAIARMRAMLSDDSFRREALGIWDKTDIAHAIDPQQWEQAGVSERRDGGAVSFAVDMPPDRASVAIGACMRYADKTAHIELARFESTGRNGLAWAVDWIAERWARTCSVVIDAQSPATVLVQDLKARGVRVTLTNSTDMGQACGRFVDMLRDGTLHHLQGQEALDIAVRGATKRNIGQSGAFGWNKRTADVDIVVGWPAKAVEGLANRVVMDGLQSESGDDLTERVRSIMDVNDLMAVADSVHTDALVHSCSFVAVLAGDTDLGEPDVIVQEFTADVATGIWDKRRHRLESALLFDVSDDYKHIDCAYLMRYGMTITIEHDRTGWHVADRYEDDAERIPCELFAYKPDERRPFGRSRIDRAVMSLTDSAVRTFLRSEMQAELYSVPPRYILGASEEMFSDEDGNPIPRWRLMLDQMLILPRDSSSGEVPQVGQFTQYSFEPHSAQLRQTATMFASATSLPPDAMGVLTDNPSSAEAIDKATKELCLLAEKCHRWFGNPWRHVIDRAQRAAGDGDVQAVRPQWRNPSTPSRAAAADAAVKLVQANILPADSEVTYDMLDLSDEQRRILRTEQRRKAAEAAIERLSAQGAHETGSISDKPTGAEDA